MRSYQLCMVVYPVCTHYQCVKGGCCTSGCYAQMHWTGESTLWDAAFRESERERLAVPGTRTAERWIEEEMEAEEEGEMEINRGSEDRGVWKRQNNSTTRLHLLLTKMSDTWGFCFLTASQLLDLPDGQHAYLQGMSGKFLNRIQWRLLQIQCISSGSQPVAKSCI